MRLAMIVAVAVASLSLVGCTLGNTQRPTGGDTRSAEAAPTPRTTKPASPNASTPTPSSPVTAQPVGQSAIPHDCKSMMSTETYNMSFKSVPLNDPAILGSTPMPPKSAFTPVVQNGGYTIVCAWRDPRADITGLELDVQNVVPETAVKALQALSTTGYTCATASEGYMCQKITTDPHYKVPVGDTYFVRANVGIHIQQANFPTNGFLNEVEDHIGWGADAD